jgi:hypothetical protein
LESLFLGANVVILKKMEKFRFSRKIVIEGKPLKYTIFVGLNLQIRKKLTLGITIFGGNILIIVRKIV